MSIFSGIYVFCKRVLHERCYSVTGEFPPKEPVMRIEFPYHDAFTCLWARTNRSKSMTEVSVSVNSVPTPSPASLHWRYNELDGVSDHQPPDCLLAYVFRHRSKKTSKLRVTGLCEGNSPVTGEFPAQKASNAENVFIWWRHHDRTRGQQLTTWNSLYFTHGTSGWKMALYGSQL